MSTAQTALRQALAPGGLICLDTNCLLYYFGGQMPWAENLRPVFEAKDGGHVRLLTSSLTLAELLAHAGTPEDETRLLSAVRQYFELIPVSEDVGIRAAGIRRDSTGEKGTDRAVETPDAIEMATAAEMRSLIFITNDEQLTKMPQAVKAVYLKELALDWVESEFDACLPANATVAVPSGPGRVSFDLLLDASAGLVALEKPLESNAFVEAALKLGALVEGPSAVVGLAEGVIGQEVVKALRVLPVGRPWITPSIPEWVGQFTNVGGRHLWREPGPMRFVDDVRRRILTADENVAEGPPRVERSMPFVVVSVSKLAAERETEALDTNGQMRPHRKRQEVWRRYLAPYRPLLPLLKLEGARLWRAEAQNGHELDLERFLKLFSCAENVIGREERR